MTDKPKRTRFYICPYCKNKTAIDKKSIHDEVHLTMCKTCYTFVDSDSVESWLDYEDWQK